MLVIYNFDRNNILVEPLNNRQAETIKTAWYLINDTLSHGQVIPKLYILDHESSLDLEASMTKKQIKYQLFPSHIHRRNSAERAIINWKIIFYLV